MEAGFNRPWNAMTTRAVRIGVGGVALAFIAITMAAVSHGQGTTA